MAGHKGPRGPKPQLKNPGKLLKRLLHFIMSRYGVQYIIVVICILISVVCTTRGTMFMKTLFDDFIVPMAQSKSTDFTGLRNAIFEVSIFYGIGIITSFIYNKLLVYISQGTLRAIRNEMFAHMQDLPIKYFDTHAHGDIMSIYTNDTDTLRQMISQSIPQLVNSIVTVISVFIFIRSSA